MPFSLLPTMMVESVTQLTPEALQRMNIRLLMLDFDNTIIPYTTNEPTPEMDGWLRSLVESSVAVCVVSNSHAGRVPAFCEKYGMSYILGAKKPFPVGIISCLQLYGIPVSDCALAGDQIFTDTLGANLAGARSILVKPINNHNIWLRARHVLEKPFIYLARKRRLPL